MQNAQHPAREASRIPERREDREVSERERQPEEEVQHVPQRFGALPVAGHHRAQQERQVHPRDAELTRRAEDRREHERADEATTNAPQTLTEPHRLGRSRPPRLATRDASAPVGSSRGTHPTPDRSPRRRAQRRSPAPPVRPSAKWPR